MEIFPRGVQGLSDTKWSGPEGSAHRLVGVDYRSEPGLIKAHQALAAVDGGTVDEFVKLSLPVSDGSSLWFSSTSGKIWREVDDVFTAVDAIEIPAFDVRTTTSDNIEKNVSAEVNIPSKVQFNPDNTIMYVLCNSASAGPGNGDNGWIFQYALSTAGDISTATYDSKFLQGDINASAFTFNDDGSKVFYVEDNGSTSVIEYDLSTNWDISTATPSGNTYDYSAQGSRANGIQFNDDGTKMFISFLSFIISEYTLSVAYDLTSTVTFVDSLDTVDQISFGAGGFDMTNDGLVLFVYENSSNGVRVHEWRMSTAWDISTATDTGRTFELGENGSGEDIDFGTGMFYDRSGFVAGNQNNPETLYQFSLDTEGQTNVTVLGAIEFMVPDGTDGADEDELDDEPIRYIYMAIEKALIRVPITAITTTNWNNDIEVVGSFVHGDDEWHDIKKQNNRLFIGDKYVVASVSEFGVFTQQTTMNVQEPERITILEPYDTDLLVITKNTDFTSRILRWDTESDSWFGQDDVYEADIHALIRDDNYVYALVGDFGQMHFYNGEILEPVMRIPGVYTPTARVKIHSNAVGYHMGVPVFGLSNIEGNPALQGVYSYGRYSRNYNVTLDLSYPVSTGAFTNLEFGSIMVRGADLYVSWTTGAAFGVDKLNWSAKYANAYIETMTLLGGDNRRDLQNLDSVTADYAELPANTGVEMQHSVNYAAFQTFAQRTDAKMSQLRSKATLKEIGQVSLRFNLQVSGNDTPKFEQFHANFEFET